MPRPRDMIAQTQTPAAPGAPATADAGQLLGRHHRVAERREQDRGPQAHPRGDPGQVGAGRHGVEPGLSHDTVAHSDRGVAGMVGPAGQWSGRSRPGAAAPTSSPRHAWE